MRVLQLVDEDREAHRLLGRGDVPHFVRLVAEVAQHVDLALVARIFNCGQFGAVAYAHHLRAAAFRLAFLAGNMRDVARLARVGDVDERGAAVLHRAGERVERGAAVMADVGDPATMVLADHRLVGAAPLQVIVAEEHHVRGARAVLRPGAGGRETQCRDGGEKAGPHASPCVVAKAAIVPEGV